MEWMLKFPNTHSNHRPIILVSDSEQKRFYLKGRRLRFEAMWLKDKSCADVVKNSWESFLGLSPVRNFTKKIDLCQENLRVWNQVTFGNVCSTLVKKLKELNRAKEMGLYQSNPSCIFQLHDDDIQALKLKRK